MKFTSIAIDGPSGAGKSTMARKVAAELGFLYVDTGAIYRSVSLYAYRAGVDKEDAERIVALLPQVQIDMEYREDGVQHMILNGEDVTDAIRENEVSLYTSAVSAIPEVRAFLLDLQRNLAATRNVIMDGRDIGTVVLPDATVKIYLTAAPEARARRRWLELKEKGSDITEAQVLEDVLQRDYNDTHREIAPLRQAEDAVLVDTTALDLEASYQLLLNTIRERI
ncbi:MAG: (d)CMP kinase [Candidatus Onthomonas sp.]|nr:(d)CMP kinase [Candidatus Onthomonas sp.]